MIVNRNYFINRPIIVGLLFLNIWILASCRNSLENSLLPANQPQLKVAAINQADRQFVGGEVEEWPHLSEQTADLLAIETHDEDAAAFHQAIQDLKDQLMGSWFKAPLRLQAFYQKLENLAYIYQQQKLSPETYQAGMIDLEGYLVINHYIPAYLKALDKIKNPGAVTYTQIDRSSCKKQNKTINRTEYDIKATASMPVPEKVRNVCKSACQKTYNYIQQNPGKAFVIALASQATVGKAFSIDKPVQPASNQLVYSEPTATSRAEAPAILPRKHVLPKKKTVNLVPTRKTSYGDQASDGTHVSTTVGSMQNGKQIEDLDNPIIPSTSVTTTDMGEDEEECGRRCISEWVGIVSGTLAAISALCTGTYVCCLCYHRQEPQPSRESRFSLAAFVCRRWCYSCCRKLRNL